jgi:Zn-dependent peptidase ImmA (M78 family)
VNTALKLAREYGVEIQFADLGDWGVDELRSEYDPQGPTIRINTRVAEQLSPSELGEFVAFSVGHELYHHREAIGEIDRLKERKDREIAANDFARKLLERQ